MQLRRNRHPAELTRAQIVTAIGESARSAMEASLRAYAFVGRPTVHMIVDGFIPPYVGYLSYRPFYRGADAEAAIARMGLLPSVIAATDLVVTWEHADLCTALELPGELPGDVFPTKMAVLDATLDPHAVHKHTLTWHPVDMRLGPPNADGGPTIIPTWHEPRSQPSSGPLPRPIKRLLTLWREVRLGNFGDTANELLAAGYRLRLTEFRSA